MVVGLLAVVFAAATARLFLWPPSAVPSSVDAVVVLSGDHGERLPRALELVHGGLAPTLVLAGTPDTVAAEKLCEGGQPFEVVCLRPDPDSTRAEARDTARLAAARRWTGIAVVTSTQHVTRTTLLFDRCWSGRLAVIGARPPLGRREVVRQVAREWLGVAEALVLRRSC